MTKGLISGQYPTPEIYDLSYFKGGNGLVSYPSNMRYLDPKSEYKSKFIDILDWMARYSRGGKVLDVGSGPCHLHTWAKSKHSEFEIYSLDFSREILSWSQRALKTNLATCASATMFPFEGESFSVVVLSDVLEHMWPKDSQKAVAEAYRVLKPKGNVFINIPNRDSWVKGSEKISGHVWLATVDEMKNLLVTEGFQRNSIRYFTRGFKFTKHFRSLAQSDLRLPIGGRSIFMTASKS